MLDIRQTPQYANHLKNIGWIIENKNEVYYFIRKFPIIGSLIKIQRPMIVDTKTINFLIDKYRAFRVIIEPKDKDQKLEIKNLKFIISNNPYLPTKTLRLDLTQTKKELLNSFKKDVRYALRKNSQLYIKKQQLKNIKDFRYSWKKAVGLKRYTPSLNNLESLGKSFKDNCLFLSAENSGAIFLLSGNTGYYWQAFTGSSGRKKLTQYKIVWEGILWAKRRGANLFDFEGIYDERLPNKTWLGFTHFKKSFGGYTIEYPECFIKNIFPFRIT